MKTSFIVFTVSLEDGRSCTFVYQTKPIRRQSPSQPHFMRGNMSLQLYLFIFCAMAGILSEVTSSKVSAYHELISGVSGKVSGDCCGVLIDACDNK